MLRAGNVVCWQRRWTGGTGYFSVSDGVLENTQDAGWTTGIYRSSSDADYEMRFSYSMRTSGTGEFNLRWADWDNRLILHIGAGSIAPKERDGGTTTTLDMDASATSTADVWYDVRAVVDGDEVTLYWGERGGPLQEILSATGLNETTPNAPAGPRATRWASWMA